MARRWCKIPKTFLCEAPDFDKGQDCWSPRDSVFITMCNKRYISKPQNKEIGSVSGKTDSSMSLLSCSCFSGWIPIWSMDAIPHNPSYSASFSPLIFLLHYPFLISLYLWLNMYFSKDADSVPLPSNHPGSTRAGPRQSRISIIQQQGKTRGLFGSWVLSVEDIKLYKEEGTLGVQKPLWGWG